MRPTRFRAPVGLLLASAMALASVPVAAYAGDEIDVATDPVQLIQEIAPDLATPISSTGTVVVVKNGRTPVVSEDEFTVPLLLDDTMASDGKIDGYEVFSSPDQASAAYLNASPGGGQLYFAADAASDVENFNVTFPSSSGARVQHTPDGENIIISLDHDQVIIIAPPWARDLAGKELPTKYEMVGNTLRQLVELSPETVFPVLADPAWMYGYQYDVGPKYPQTIRNLMHDCFNCIFPIAGAPAAFPAPNQLLPLTVGGLGNFECRMGLEDFLSYATYYEWSYFLNATKNHIDGAGSGITFSFQRDTLSDPETKLVVTAYVVNDFGGPVGQGAYSYIASAQWALFAINVRNA